MKPDRLHRSAGSALSSLSLSDATSRLERFGKNVRSPLHTALGTAELLRDTALNPQQLALVDAFIKANEVVLAEIQELFGNPSGRYVPAGKDAPQDSVAFDPSGVSILLVDDNRVNLALTRETLERQGYTVRTAVDGQEALDVFRTRQVSLVLMDIEMPIMNGLDACNAMRREEERTRTPRVPMIALTADSAEGMIDRVLQHGFDAYLAKPASRAHLLVSIEQMLRTVPQ